MKSYYKKFKNLSDKISVHTDNSGVKKIYDSFEVSFGHFSSASQLLLAE